MGFRIACPGCQHVYALTDEHRGQTLRCQKCLRPFQVPGLAAAPPAPPAPPARSSQTVKPVAPRPAPAATPPSRAVKPGAPKPAPAAAAPRPRTPAPQERAAPPRRQARPAPQRSMLPVLLVAGGAAAVCFIGGLLALWFLFLRPGTTDAQTAATDTANQEDKGKEVRKEDKTEDKKENKKEDKREIKKEDKKEDRKEDKTEDRKEDKREDRKEDKKEVKNNGDNGKINQPPPVEVKQPDPPETRPQEKLLLPATLSPKDVQRIKHATVQLRVTRPGSISEGSGFFSLEPGVVVTNAHVLGMLQADSRPPNNIEVIVRSGLPGEVTFKGAVLGVDRETDLAVVRVEGPPDKLAEPLPVVSAADLNELQKVYIFGFPFGSQLGKNITVAESSVSSLRSDKYGILNQIQVNGGMHPGNSGGPVVNTRGEVVGVAVAGIRGTQINFAVPGDFARLIARGRIQETFHGEPFLENKQRHLPVTLVCLDPLRRIRAMHVEVWTGDGGAARPAADRPPAALPGDGGKMTYPVTLEGGVGKVAVPYTPMANKVLFIQPVVTSTTGDKYWAVVVPHRPSSAPPLEALPAVLKQKYEGTPERTLTLNTSSQVRLARGKDQQAFVLTTKVTALELVTTHKIGGAMRVYVGDCQAAYEVEGKRATMPARLVPYLKVFSTSYAADPAGALKERGDPSFKKLPPNVREDVEDMYNRIANGYEATCYPVPNREVQPREKWKARQPMLIAADTKKEIVDILLVCTYEGSRVGAAGTEAVISLTGEVRGRDTKKQGQTFGRVRGRVLFNTERGFVSDYQIKVTSELGGGEAVVTYDVFLTRVAGNLANITPPKKGPPQVAKGKVHFQIKGDLTQKSPVDSKIRPGTRMNIYPVKMGANRKYVFDMKLVSGKLDPYLRIEDDKGQQLAFDDDGGGFPNARLEFTPPRTATYRVIATSCNPGEFGAYELTLSELQ